MGRNTGAGRGRGAGRAGGAREGEGDKKLKCRGCIDRCGDRRHGWVKSVGLYRTESGARAKVCVCRLRQRYICNVNVIVEGTVFGRFMNNFLVLTAYILSSFG